MKSITKIIKEEIIKLLNENEDADEYFFDKNEEIRSDIIYDFFYKNNQNFTKSIPWRVIPFPRLKKIWEDYIRTGVVRDEKGIEMIKNIMISNTIKINIITELVGRSNSSDEYIENNELFNQFINDQLTCILSAIINNTKDSNQLEIPFDDNYNNNDCNNVKINPYIKNLVVKNYTNNITYDELKNIILDDLEEKFFNYYTSDKNNKMGGFISDYGLNPLLKLLRELLNSVTPENDLYIIDKMLNVIHQSSDIASWFVEGGTYSLNSLSGYSTPDNDSVISGKYKMSDYYD